MFIACDLDHKNRNGGSDFNREKRELVALHLLSFGCPVTLPHCAVGWSAVVIAAFPDHTHFFNWPEKYA